MPAISRRGHGHRRAAYRYRSEGWTERAKKISALLHEAAETHHIVYRITDGDDPDWASWYADWLVNNSELPDLLDVEPAVGTLSGG